MNHAGPCAHALNFARADDSDVAHIIAVLQGAVDNIGEDFHFTMRMERESAGGRHDVVIENAQRAKIHICRVMVMVERKMSMCVKPICFSMVALICADRFDHGFALRVRLAKYFTFHLILALDAIGLFSSQVSSGGS